MVGCTKGNGFWHYMAASGLAGTVMPFILEALLQRYGYKITLRGLCRCHDRIVRASNTCFKGPIATI